MARRTNNDEIETVEEVQKTFFPGCELEQVDEFEFLDYDRINLSDLDSDDEFDGKPYLTEVQSYNYDDDGTEKTNHCVHLYIVDDDAEEYLDIKINLKKDGDIQEKVHKLSKLYAFATGIMELENPDSTKGMNQIRRIDLGEFHKFTNDLNKMVIKVITKSSKTMTYNTFKVLKVSL